MENELTCLKGLAPPDPLGLSSFLQNSIGTREASLMRKTTGTVWRTNGHLPDVVSESSTLEAKIESTLSWSSSVYTISNLSTDRADQDSNVFLCTFQLDRLDEISGKTRNPALSTQLSIKAEGKEIALLSGMLGRYVAFGELRYTRLLQQEAMVSEIRQLREENSNLRQEVDNLYGALERLQRPKLIS